MQRDILKNGLISLFYPIDNAYSVSLSLNIRAGVITEKAENNGITHLLEHLHFRRLGDMTQEELYYKMDIIGGNLYAETYREMLRFKIKVRPKYLYDAIFILKNILTAYNWTEADIESEKEIILNEIREKERYGDFYKEVQQVLLKDTPVNMSIIGKAETLLNISRKDIIDYKKTVFSQNNVALAVVGNITEKDRRRINAYFEDVELENAQTVKTGLSKKFKNEIVFLEYDTDYLSCVMSFRVYDDVTKYELNLLNAVLGEGQSSLLQREIRERALLSYDIYSYIEEYSDFSMINIFFSCSKENLYACIEKIISVLNSLKMCVDKKEINSVMTYYTENLWYLLEDPQLLNEELSWDVFAESEKTVEERIEIYKSIDKECLFETAKKIFVSDNCVFVVDGKSEEISKGVIINAVKSL